jgi:very-short-patch-repair endonuclease
METLSLVIKKRKKKGYKVLSQMERRMVDVFLKYETLDFETNYKVGYYYVDVAFPKHKVGLEIDGHEFHSSDKARTRDELRDEYLQTVEGWKIERVPGWLCYRNPEVAAAKVLRHVPEVKDHPLFRQACIAAKQWFIRDLLSRGYRDEAIKALQKGL